MSWDPYLDLEAGVLRNRLGITDSEALRRAESGISAVRIAQLATQSLPGDDDLAHPQAFHRLIVGDVYPWAGELRTVSIGKSALFCPRNAWSATPTRCSARSPASTSCAAGPAPRSSTG